MTRKSCFVVMGFNEKQDPFSGRVLDLDKTYRGIIKPAAEEAGFECFCAGEIQHAGAIDIPMYEWLLKAELVIADLSTLNANAFFELGVRYALKTRTTIVIAEDGFRNPFDTNHIALRRYRHDGKALDFEVVETFRQELIDAIREIDAAGNVDSPVYTHLHGLTPPVLRSGQDAAEEATEAASTAPVTEATSASVQDALQNPFARMLEQAMAMRAEERFKEANATGFTNVTGSRQPAPKRSSAWVDRRRRESCSTGPPVERRLNPGWWRPPNSSLAI